MKSVFDQKPCTLIELTSHFSKFVVVFKNVSQRIVGHDTDYYMA